MWSSRNNRKSYQVIDDEYDDSHDRYASSSRNAERSIIFSGQESQPLITGNYNSSAVNVDPNPTVLPPQMVSTTEEDDQRWDHIENLDQFFSGVYDYHQGGGFICTAWEKILALIQFLFIVYFSTFFLQCVDYDVMFGNKNTTTTGEPINGKKHFKNMVIQDCASHLHPMVVLCLIMAAVFWIIRVIKTFYNLIQMREIQLFYNNALKIPDDQLINLTWPEVLQRISAVQPHLHLTIHKESLESIDVYNRILRYKNYFVAMVNQKILPPVIDVPFVGQIAYLPEGLKQNMLRCLFLGSNAPWNGPCLKEEYKDELNLNDLARELEKSICWYGLMNLVLIPFIFVYQILYSFFVMSEMIKKNPDSLGMRRYSNYGRYRVRHFNELKHELNARLNRSHNFAHRYMEQFFSPLAKVFATHIRFMVGAVGITLGLLTMWDEDVIQIEHVLTVIAVCGGVFVVCNGFIPEENLIWQPENLLARVASELHYIPVEWQGFAHTEKVRNEFTSLFQLKWVYLIHELASPLITPFILLFWLRPRARLLVQFFHENTVSVQGLGDICSFALMDVGRHGDPMWQGNKESATNNHDGTMKANDGKTELSVLHFKSINPDWVPPPASEQFVRDFKDKIDRDVKDLSSTRRNIFRESVTAIYPQSFSGTNSMLDGGANRFVAPLDRSLLDSVTRNSGSIIEGNDNKTSNDLCVQALFLRGMHHELKMSLAPSTYGTSISDNSRSLFDVPNLSAEDSHDLGGPSRLVLNAPHGVFDEREEDNHHSDNSAPHSSNYMDV